MLSGLANEALVGTRTGGCGSDLLTGLANAEAFADVIAAARPGPATLILFDMDGLKRINERFGYSTGDRVLRILASRLQRGLSREGWIARIEGDRFGVLLPAALGPAEATGFVEALRSSLSAPIRHGGALVEIGVSAGVAVLPAGRWPRDALGRAETALVLAKSVGGRCVRVFDAMALRPATPRLAREDDLMRALRQGEWELHYQPQYRLPDRHLVGAEALLRWRHPSRGLLAPASFLAQLEGHPTVREVGRWIVRQACRDLARWRGAGLDIAQVSVNLFADQLQQPTLRRTVAAALAEHGLAPADLELEITENVALDLPATVLHDLQVLRRDGVGIALDDFGTGFACLSTLRRLPVSCLKIDRSFVANLRSGSADRALVRAILALGRDLRLRVVVEGVETAEQTRRLLRMGCRIFQGHHFGRPEDAPTFAADRR